MKMKRAISFFLISLSLLLVGCTKNLAIIKDDSRPLKQVENISEMNYNATISECQKIIDESTAANYTMFGTEIISKEDVHIKAIPLTLSIIQVLVKKKALERRWDNKTYLNNLNDELIQYTNFRYDFIEEKIVEKSPDDTTRINTLSFKVSFENNTNPFRTLEVDGGFECFFLENAKGLFGRVESVMDDFTFDYFLIDGFMSTIITFHTINDFNEALYSNDLSKKEIHLVFNGIQTKPIRLNWILTF